MANKDQVVRLRNSSAETNRCRLWNEWRQDNPAVCPDLSHADLSRLDLTGADLSRADLQMANLSNAKLRDADLTGADLRVIGMHDADFTGAKLLEIRITRPGEERSDGKWNLSSVFDLATSVGLHHAEFSDPTFLERYVAEAFEHFHRPDIPERNRKLVYFFAEGMTERLRMLRQLLDQGTPPTELIQVVGLITDELIRHLKKHPKILFEIKPRQFEELIAEILAAHGWQVRVSQATRDGGYDIFAINQTTPGVEDAWIIECKRYAQARKVGVDVVRALYGTKMHMGVGNAMLATTTDFTSDAKAFKASKYDLHLKGYEQILEWINTYKPNADGTLYVRNRRLTVRKRS